MRMRGIWKYRSRNTVYSVVPVNIKVLFYNSLRMSENGVLKRIFGSTRDEVTGGWIKLHNEELHY
jgi:hypothetical protein